MHLMSNDRTGHAGGMAWWGQWAWAVEAVVLLPRPHCSLEPQQRSCT